MKKILICITLILVINKIYNEEVSVCADKKINGEDWKDSIGLGC